MTKIICISDTHGYHWDRRLVIPDGDYLVHAGDFTIRGGPGEIHNFADLLEEQSKRFKAIVFIAGNHDWLFEINPSWAKSFFSHIPNVHYLDNEEKVINGIKFYGIPQTKIFHNWAFNVTEEELSEHYSKIPLDTDVLLTHSPIFGIGDVVEGKTKNLGSLSLKFHSLERVRPALHVTGHIHSGNGLYRNGRTHVVNAAILNEEYTVAYSPHIVYI